jgi:TolA-binding protein
VDDLIQAASAWSRTKESDRALAAYDQIVRRYPNSRAAEQALHSKAHSFYGSGQWSRAIRAYTQYLNRYGQGKKARQARFVLASRYERAVAQLAAGDGEGARARFEQLGQSRHSGYEESMLEHLEAVALAGLGFGAQAGRSGGAVRAGRAPLSAVLRRALERRTARSNGA